MIAETEIFGMIFDLKRSCLHDGPGVRTVIFLKGCLLECAWCHNPESISPCPEISFDDTRCLLCGACAAVCPTGAHSIELGKHFFDRGKCRVCGKCAESCLSYALGLIGEKRTAGELLDEVMRDKSYYDNSGGGLTLSGGEPFIQPDFAIALLQGAKAKGIHTCVETSGQVSFDILERATPFVDIFLYDIKETDPGRHRNFTGQDNRLSLENLFKLDGCGAKIILRCPIIPGWNDRKEHFIGIASIANRLGNLAKIDLLPFHPYADYKHRRLSKVYALKDLPVPDPQAKEKWRKTIAEKVKVDVEVG